MLLFLVPGEVLGQRIAVFDDDTQRAKLRRSCFRPKDIGPRAGNFRRWRSLVEVFHDRPVRRAFIEEARRVIERYGPQFRDENRPFREVFTVDAGRPIGWSATGVFDEYPPDDLEPFRLSEHGIAQRIRAETGHLAPATTLVTFRCHFRSEYDRRYGPEWKAVIRSLFPGPYAGEPVGRVTEREGLVFFDRDHEGVPLAG